jgi:hypothetical protein
MNIIKTSKEATQALQMLTYMVNAGTITKEAANEIAYGYVQCVYFK